MTTETIQHLNYDEPVLRYHRILAEIAAGLLPKNGVVMDVGCGLGQVLGELNDRRPDAELHGMDSDRVCVETTTSRVPECTVHFGDIDNVAAEQFSSRFDLVISSHSLEHMPAPVDALQAWSKLLKPSGRLMVAVPNIIQPIFVGRALARREKTQDGHYYAWDKATFENFCRLAGFEIEESMTDYVPLSSVRTRVRFPIIEKVERSLLTVVPQLSNSHIAILRSSASESPQTQ